MIIVSLSGGKDSVAMLLQLVERYGAPGLLAHHQILPEDWPETVPYCHEVCDHLGVQLLAQQIIYEPVGDDTAVRRHDVLTDQILPWGTGMIAGVTDLAIRRGWPPSPGVRYCTRYFKQELLDWWIRQNHQEQDVIVCLGERAAESPRRAKKHELGVRFRRKNYTAWNWLPVLTWSRRDVFRKLRDYGIQPHPAYKNQGMTEHQMYDTNEEGGPRTSCRFCIYATQADVCHQAQMESNAGMIARIEEVERLTGRHWWMQPRQLRTPNV